MATLSKAEIASLAKGAGFKGKDVEIAVAVALAESGGDPRAHNPVGRDNSYGLWQINMLGSMGPERRKRFGLKSNEDLFDPATNAKAAYGIWQSQGWERGWTTYSSGKYKKFMGGVDTSGDATTGSDTATQPEPASGLSIGDAIARGTNAISLSLFKGIANVSGILLAIAFIVIGVLILARGQLSSLVPAKAIKKALK